MTTLNKLIDLLESAKKEFGGEILVCSFNAAGDKIDPDKLEEVFICRGKNTWWELHITGN